MKNNELKYHELIKFYRKHPTMLSSPYTLHINLYYKFQRRLTPLGYKIFSKLPLKDSKVFDFGCGLGSFLAYAKLRGAKFCIGRDLDNFILPENMPYIDQLDIEEDSPLPYPKNTFDVVICSEVLEHTRTNWRDIIKELIRITKIKGILFISTPNYFNLCGLIKWIFEKSGHYKRHTWAPFQKYLPQINEQPLKSFQILRELKKYHVKILEKRSIWWLDSWVPWIYFYSESKLYTGLIDLIRCCLDNLLSTCIYGGLQFYCIVKKMKFNL